jgi:hypothetical protein
MSVGQSAITVLGVIGIVFTIHWLVGVIVVGAALPSAYVRFRYSGRMYQWQRRSTVEDRRSWYLHWLLTDGTYAKELRLFDLGEYLHEIMLSLAPALRGVAARLLLDEHDDLAGDVLLRVTGADLDPHLLGEVELRPVVLARARVLGLLDDDRGVARQLAGEAHGGGHRGVAGRAGAQDQDTGVAWRGVGGSHGVSLRVRVGVQCWGEAAGRRAAPVVSAASRKAWWSVPA